MKKLYIENLPLRAEEIAPLLCRGYGNAEIGRILHLSYYTVRSYVVNMLERTGSRNRMELAYKLGCYENEIKMQSYMKIKGKGQ